MDTSIHNKTLSSVEGYFVRSNSLYPDMDLLCKSIDSGIDDYVLVPKYVQRTLIGMSGVLNLLYAYEGSNKFYYLYIFIEGVLTSHKDGKPMLTKVRKVSFKTKHLIYEAVVEWTNLSLKCIKNVIIADNTDELTHQSYMNIARITPAIFIMNRPVKIRGFLIHNHTSAFPFSLQTRLVLSDLQSLYAYLQSGMESIVIKKEVSMSTLLTDYLDQPMKTFPWKHTMFTVAGTISWLNTKVSRPVEPETGSNAVIYRRPNLEFTSISYIELDRIDTISIDSSIF